MSIAYPQGSIDFPRAKWHLRRYELTMSFLRRHIRKGSHIIDLGTPNAMSDIMKEYGYKVKNTEGEDLDIEYKKLHEYYIRFHPDAVTSFEVFEHLINPYEVLKRIPSGRLVASVPLRLWFAKAYNRNKNDRHFHEFEQWQFDWLLEKAGWRIMARETHTSPSLRLGFRSILRWFAPRYYFIYAIRDDRR